MYKNGDYTEVEGGGDNVPPIFGCNSRKLVEGISLKDLCDGKEVVFELDKIENDLQVDVEEEEEEEEVVHYDIRSLRGKRGAPPLDRSFESLANEMFDVTGDGYVKKQLVTNGIGHEVPDNSYVTVHYNLYKRNCQLPFDSTFLRGRPEKFRLDQGEAIMGLECAIKTMKKNENSCFFIKWQYAFGVLGCPDRIEPKCDIIADVTLIDYVEVNNEADIEAVKGAEFGKIDFSRVLNEAKKLICNAKDHFSKGETKTAVINYKKSLKNLNSLRLANEEQERIMLSEKIRCLLNLAICYNKLGKSEQACTMCQEVLSFDPNNVKAYFHYGKATLVLSNFDKARKLLLRADKLKPNDPDINRELKRLNDKKSLYKLEDTLFCRKAFRGKEPKDNTPEKASSLETFEASLRESLNECLETNKPYILSQSLLEDERKVCKKVAQELHLNFETKEHFNIFKPNHRDKFL